MMTPDLLRKKSFYGEVLERGGLSQLISSGVF